MKIFICTNPALPGLVFSCNVNSQETNGLENSRIRASISMIELRHFGVCHSIIEEFRHLAKVAHPNVVAWFDIISLSNVWAQ